MQVLKLKIGNYKYDVCIGNQIVKTQLQNYLTHQNSRVFIVTTDKIKNIYQNFLDTLIDQSFTTTLITISDGETFKNAVSLEHIYNVLIQNNANRKSLIIAFGGGVIGDLAGYAAATYMRGIDLIQIPTTLLAQVDSSIGGKTGMNHPLAKNSIGAFKQPNQTIIDVQFLQTLPKRELVSGYAEIFKHSLIQDSALFDQLIQGTPLTFYDDQNQCLDVIKKSCLIKIKIVEEDEKEQGNRALLNFGHTIAHFIETQTLYKKYLHGEAVFVGCHFASWLSYKKGFINFQEFDLIHQHLSKLHLIVELENLTKDDFIQIIGLDKKNSDDGINYIFLKTIGEAFIQRNTSIQELWDCFQEYLKTTTAMIFTK